MALSIHQMDLGDADGIRGFNSRLERAGVTFAFPVDPQELMQRRPGTDAPFQTAFVLTDGSAVRGAYILKEERLFCRGKCLSAGNYQLPLSEGIIDRRYGIVGVQLIGDALARQTRLYCLGMGSTARPLPQLLSRLGWAISRVPFLFRIQNSRNFAREIRWLRQRRAYRLALDISWRTGILTGFVGLRRLHSRGFGKGLPADVSVREVPSLSGDIDELFSHVHGDYGLLCDRRAAAMNQKLPPQDSKLSRQVLYRAGKLVGWVVLSVSRVHDHTQFGNMVLGCIVDGLAAPADVAMLVGAACKRLEAAGCDLLVSNQSHPAWISALRRRGFLSGPSNFVLALSPELAARAAGTLMHFTRADGDGPINL